MTQKWLRGVGPKVPQKQHKRDILSHFESTFSHFGSDHLESLFRHFNYFWFSGLLEGHPAYEQRRVDLATFRAVPASACPSAMFYYSLGHPWKGQICQMVFCPRQHFRGVLVPFYLDRGSKNFQNWVKNTFLPNRPVFTPSPPLHNIRIKTFISCYRTPGPHKGFRRVSEGFSEGVSEGVSEGFSKGFRRVSEGVSRGPF